jgi:uroporphyrinogen decarboxylase
MLYSNYTTEHSKTKQNLRLFTSPHEFSICPRERVKLLGAGGGYVFATIHNIQADIPPEKILAIYDTVAE